MSDRAKGGLRDWVLMALVGLGIAIVGLAQGDGTFAGFGALIVLVAVGGIALRLARDYDARRQSK